jgi:aryl-alcohol dehydrogenase-like predicted oxidoreductase
LPSAVTSRCAASGSGRCESPVQASGGRPATELPRERCYTESIGALDTLRSEGKIRHIGVSNVTAEQLAVARTITDIATPAHLEANLAAAALRLDQDEMQAITAAASRATQG